MRDRLRCRALPALLSSLAAGACAQSPPTDHADAQERPRAIERQPAEVWIEQPRVLDRVAVVGASASAGFLCLFPDHHLPVSFDRAFGAILAQPNDSEVFGFASAMFFNNAREFGPGFMDQALEREPTLLIGIDYLFWFGYGHLDHLGRPVRGEAQRLEMLEFGLQQLDRFDGPIVVGDFPDMSAAIGLMLARQQVPKPETLVALNERLQDWASERPEVIVMPLAAMVRQIGEGNGLAMGNRQWTGKQAATFVITDKLHPSPEGQIAGATIIADLLGERLEEIDPASFDLDHDRVVSRLKNQGNPQGSGG